MPESICQSCALCCDGTLFRDFQADAPTAGLVAQPCACLHGRLCGVYPDRPRACRDFECRVVKSLQAGTLDVAGAQHLITTAQSLLAQLDALLPADLSLTTTALDDAVERYQQQRSQPPDPEVLLQMAVVRLYLDKHFRPEPPA